MNDMQGRTFASTIAPKFTRPHTPGWRRPLILLIAGLSAFLTYVTIDLARGVGAREAVLIGLTFAMIGLGLLTRSTLWSVAALVCAVAAGVLGCRVQADGDLSGIYVGLGGMFQVANAYAVLLTAAVLAVTEFVHTRSTGRGR